MNEIVGSKQGDSVETIQECVCSFLLHERITQESVSKDMLRKGNQISEERKSITSNDL